RDVHDIDCQIFYLRQKTLDPTSDHELTDFETAISEAATMRNKSITEIKSLNDAIEQMRDELPLSILANSDVMSNKVADICYEIAVKEQKVKDLENHIDQELKFASGPLATTMDDVLHANKIPRQQYHGKSFVGNHVHKACK
ncbi:uncharacterized protein LOC117111996, partial [Anneissia japonica]|uniref:uncharacterized protein LOC117111996 n=1 Tax=Anneissia japonica TaxID=1529436 RepID=UPI0014258831